jgi:hypothetical protein
MFFTAVRRSHIVGPSGVGAITLTKNGISALVMGLPTWVSKIPTRINSTPADIQQQRLKELQRLEIHDYGFEAELQVTRLIEPPITDPENADQTTWFVPAVRFPTWEFCSRPWCRVMATFHPEDMNLGYCQSPDCTKGSKKRKGWPTQQVPVVLCCSKGHLDEVDWVNEVHAGSPCAQPNLRYSGQKNAEWPTVTCVNCNSAKTFRGEGNSSWVTKCSGASPWLENQAPTACDQLMYLTLRTSTQMYFPNIRSSLYMPAPTGLRDEVVRWLTDSVEFQAVLRSNIADAQVSAVYFDRAKSIFAGLSPDELSSHINHVRASRAGVVDWGRGAEMQALKTPMSLEVSRNSPPLLVVEQLEIDRFDPGILGPTGLFQAGVAVHRLAETRALTGFSRRVSAYPAIREGMSQLWGFMPSADDELRSWVPGYRVYGEGIYLELNSSRLTSWLDRYFKSVAARDAQRDEMSPSARAAHTFAHLLINAASIECGYPVASIRDRIYEENGTTALLIYTAAGDSVGTMGGLVELSQPGRLEVLVTRALSAATWCRLDPICLNPTEHLLHGASGACHQCCYLPETSCERFNSGLDRALLVGRDEQPGYLQLHHSSRDGAKS